MRFVKRSLRFTAHTMLTCAFICTPLAAQAADDAFCTSLKAVVADAPNGFAGFRGDLTRKEQSTIDIPTTYDHYAVSKTLDGAASCEIRMQEEATSSGGHLPNYGCDFPIKGADKGAAARQIANRVAACIAGTSRPSGFDVKKDGGMVTMHDKDYALSYMALSGPANNLVSLSIQASRK